MIPALGQSSRSQIRATTRSPRVPGIWSAPFALAKYPGSLSVDGEARSQGSRRNERNVSGYKSRHAGLAVSIFGVRHLIERARRAISNCKDPGYFARRAHKIPGTRGVGGVLFGEMPSSALACLRLASTSRHRTANFSCNIKSAVQELSARPSHHSAARSTGAGDGSLSCALNCA
jgi:hypothetical protein